MDQMFSVNCIYPGTWWHAPIGRNCGWM